ncbi:MAG: inositol-3-phosphate synthase [Candidatus Bathyarchaeia archaeon]|jgi:myo-inositol-1-phosphate synthase
MGKIRVALAGIGNNASSFVQGMFYYKNSDSEKRPGLIHYELGGYKLSDFELVAAFDVDKNKVGRDLSEAIFTPPTNTPKWVEVPRLDVEVMMGPVKDSLDGETIKTVVKPADREPVDLADVLKKTRADVLVNFLPTGSVEAVRAYADACLKDAKVAFCNGMPTSVANDPEYANIAERNRVPLIGDDTKSQVGGSYLNRGLAKLMADRGVRVTKSYQVNIGGDMDFFNMEDTKRVASKHKTKTASVKSSIPYDFEFYNHNGYIPWLGATKICYVRIEGLNYGGNMITIDAKLRVIDSTNSVACIIDEVRCCKLAKDRGIGGVLLSASAYYCKHPPEQLPDDEARTRLEGFIAGKRQR